MSIFTAFAVTSKDAPLWDTSLRTQLTNEIRPSLAPGWIRTLDQARSLVQPRPALKLDVFFQYVSDDGTRVLVHYLGDESLYKDFKRGITPKRKARNMFQIKTVKPSETPVRSGTDVVTVYSYRDIIPTTTRSGGVRIQRQWSRLVQTIPVPPGAPN